MAKSYVYSRTGATPAFNMTPMIDVTFQLIIFFILAGSFASLDLIRLDVPELHDPNPIAELQLSNKVVVNIPPYPPEEIEAEPHKKGRAKEWQVRNERPRVGAVEELARVLRLARANFDAGKAKRTQLTDTELEVELRADQSVRYEDVAPALVAITQAGFSRVHYVAYSAPEGQ